MVVSNVPLAKGHPSTKAILSTHIGGLIKLGTLHIEPGGHEGHIKEKAVNSEREKKKEMGRTN